MDIFIFHYCLSNHVSCLKYYVGTFSSALTICCNSASLEIMDIKISKEIVSTYFKNQKLVFGIEFDVCIKEDVIFQKYQAVVLQGAMRKKHGLLGHREILTDAPLNNFFLLVKEWMQALRHRIWDLPQSLQRQNLGLWDEIRTFWDYFGIFWGLLVAICMKNMKTFTRGKTTKLKQLDNTS